MEFIKILHIIAIISWMAGLLYLPRLFVYHATAASDDMYKQFLIMERRLFLYIMTPAMVVSFITGFILAFYYNYISDIWFILKFICVNSLLYIHILCYKYYRNFAVYNNNKSTKFYRIFNEAPTILMVIIVTLVIIKP